MVRAEIEAHSPSVSCQTLALDLCSVPSILNFTRTVKKLFEADGAPGKLHLLVNNAGKTLAPECFSFCNFFQFAVHCNILLVGEYLINAIKVLFGFINL